MTALVRSATLTGFEQVARDLGLDARRLLQRAGLAERDLADPDTWISAEAVRELLESAARESGADDVGLRLAAQRRLGHLGPIALIARGEPTVRAALEAMTRFLRSYNDSVAVAIDEDERLAIVRTDLLLTGRGGVRQITELSVGVLFRTLIALIGDPWRPEAVCLSRPTPARASSHRRFFGMPVRFDQEFDGVVLRRRDLDRPIPESDPILARYIRHYLDTVARPGATSAAAQVRQLVHALLASGRCSADEVARHLGVDRRTVHRRLAAEGECFSGVVEAVREQLVTRHLQTGERTITDVARLLGFEDPSAFSRWFRQRHGCSASAWRRDHATPGRAGPRH